MATAAGMVSTAETETTVPYRLAKREKKSDAIQRLGRLADWYDKEIDVLQAKKEESKFGLTEKDEKKLERCLLQMDKTIDRRDALICSSAIETKRWKRKMKEEVKNDGGKNYFSVKMKKRKKMAKPFLLSKEQEEEEESAVIDILDPDAKVEEGDKGGRMRIFSSESAISFEEELGKGMRGEVLSLLRSHQIRAAEKVIKNVSKERGTMLAHVMGLGKSLSVLAALSHMRRRCLICCPKSLIMNWKDEILKWPQLELPAPLFEKESLQWKESERGILIMNYESLSKLEDEREDFVFVADEAHMLRNSTDKSCMHNISGIRTRRRVFLTGTPVMNSMSEFYTMMSLLDNSILGQDKKEFTDFFPQGMSEEESKRKNAALRARIQSYVDEQDGRILKEQLPERREFVVRHEGTDLDASSSVLSKVAVSKAHIPIKTEVVSNIITSILSSRPDDKVIVFSTYIDPLHAMEESMKGKGISSTFFKGSQSPSISMEKIDEFQKYNQVLFMTIEAGNAGFNITAANHVILVEPRWNSGADLQAIARAYRIGQTKEVFVYRLLGSGSLEEEWYQMSLNKLSLSSTVTSAVQDNRHEKGDLPPFLSSLPYDILVRESILSEFAPSPEDKACISNYSNFFSLLSSPSPSFLLPPFSEVDSSFLTSASKKVPVKIHVSSERNREERLIQYSKDSGSTWKVLHTTDAPFLKIDVPPSSLSSPSTLLFRYSLSSSPSSFSLPSSLLTLPCLD